MKTISVLRAVALLLLGFFLVGATECHLMPLRGVTPHVAYTVSSPNCWPMQKDQSVDVKSGTQDKIEGNAKAVAGKIKEKAGKAVGNPRLEAKGDCDQIEGNAQKKVGEIKKVFGK